LRCVVCCFFFSSRRRHTRSYGDWSSDVCSSDLAILQPPYFDPGADPAVNYGGIGGVIGHEMGHAFDDQGSKSDGNGVLRTWWKRSEERRVGKEGRGGWWAEVGKRKGE